MADVTSGFTPWTCWQTWRPWKCYQAAWQWPSAFLSQWPKAHDSFFQANFILSGVHFPDWCVCCFFRSIWHLQECVHYSCAKLPRGYRFAGKHWKQVSRSRCNWLQRCHHRLREGLSMAHWCFDLLINMFIFIVISICFFCCHFADWSGHFQLLQ